MVISSFTASEKINFIDFQTQFLVLMSYQNLYWLSYFFVSYIIYKYDISNL